jgi:chromosome segregation ATPase
VDSPLGGRSTRVASVRDTAGMAADRASELLALAQDLEQRDLDVAARIAAVTALLQGVDRTREHALAVRSGLEAIPAEILRAEEAERDARAREADARLELAEAERRFEEVGRSRRSGADARASAERAVRRATVAAADAASTVARMREQLEALVRKEAGLQAEGEGLAVEARHVAVEVAAMERVSESGRSRPGVGLAEIEEWGARAHAALFVVRGGLENERERIVLEANTLAAATLSDHAGGSSVALVRRRLEEALGRS